MVIDITNPFTDPPQPVTMWLMNDEQFLYVALEDLNQTQPASNFLRLYFDRDNNNTWDATSPSMEGDFVFDDFGGETRIRFRRWIGDYPSATVESFTDDSAGVTAVLSAASGHLAFETAIDLTQSALLVSPDSTFGFRVF